MAETSNMIDLGQAADSISKPWNPLIVAELNGQHVKIAKLEGAFIWHSHADEDEMFLVLDGSLELHFRDHVVTLREGQACVVPRGVEHKPVATPMATVLLFEPASTVNTGDASSDDRTLRPDQLARF